MPTNVFFFPAHTQSILNCPKWIALRAFSFLWISFLLSANFPSAVFGQYIATNGEPNVNRPLMRWEQFQRQLRLNQRPPPPTPPNSYFLNQPANPLLFSPPSSLGPTSPLPPTLFTPASLFPPLYNPAVTVSPVQWTRPIELIASQQGRPLLWSNNQQPGSTPVQAYRPSSISSSSSPLSNHTGNVQPASSIPNGQWKANMVHLSRRLTNLTLTFTDNQFPSFLRLVHELSGLISTDCLSSTISLFYGIRRQQQWAVQSKISQRFL